MKLNIAQAVVEVDSEVYLAGHDEDGRDFTAERYFVQATFECGKRFVHYAYFNGTKPERDEEDGFSYFPDLREEARASATRIRDRVAAAGVIDTLHWDEVTPAYGSVEYQSQGIEFLRIIQEKEGMEYDR